MLENEGAFIKDICIVCGHFDLARGKANQHICSIRRPEKEVPPEKILIRS
jgi:hypothetical protein